MKAKYGEKAKLCYLATDGFIVYIKIDDIYKDTAEDVERKLGASNYELNGPIPKRKSHTQTKKSSNINPNME